MFKSLAAAALSLGLLCFVATGSLLRPKSSSRAAQRTTAQQRRHLQEQGLDYVVDYTAQFQVLQDSFCDGPPPTIRVNCRGRNIEILNTSHPAIQCNTTSRVDETGWSYVECHTTCASVVECQEIYLEVDGTLATGAFGVIDFSCAGNALTDVDGAVIFSDGGNGVCAASTAPTRNFHALRLGVSCPSATNARVRSYVFDDVYLECNPAIGSYNYGDDIYTCVDGRNCNGASCEVDFTTLIVEADVPNFASTCVETVVPMVPTTPPVPVPTNDARVYATVFVAAWGLLFDATSGNVCNGYTPTVRLECQYDNVIALVSPETDALNCTTVSTSIVECTDTNSFNFVDQFRSSVRYNCSGPVLPESVVGFVESQAFCDGNVAPATVTHSLQLGMVCSDASTTFDFYGDLFFDCVGVSPTFGFYDEFASTESANASRYTCSETATFAIGSNASAIQTIPYLAVSTDAIWATSPDEACYTVVGANGTTLPPVVSAPTLPPIRPPTLAPVLSAPIPVAATVPTTAPRAVLAPPPVMATPVPMRPPSSAPPKSPPVIVAPVSPVTIPTTVLVESSNESIPIGPILGGAAGGLLVASVVAFFALRRKPEITHPSLEHKPAVLVAPVDPSDSGTYLQSSAGRHDPTEYNEGSEWDQSPNDRVLAHHEAHIPSPIRRYMAPLPSRGQTSPTQPHTASGDRAGMSGQAPSNGSPSRQTPAHTVNFKDQARSVLNVETSSEPNVTSSGDRTYATGSAPSSGSPSRRPPAHTVDFKDQARSVLYEVPMAHVQAIEVAPAAEITAVAEPTNILLPHSNPPSDPDQHEPNGTRALDP